ncbi:ATP10 protein-domain-containing protein [Lipomyces japonicus]|uniref:ATP10 protein-domain-containing protein n=1 Tax=Lipomyces japonicus TaxID=56871 RepID=UPI0034CF62C9
MTLVSLARSSRTTVGSIFQTVWSYRTYATSSQESKQAQPPITPAPIQESPLSLVDQGVTATGAATRGDTVSEFSSTLPQSRVPSATQLPQAVKKEVKKDLSGGVYLIRPIGVRSPPHPDDNTGIDKRTKEQKRADFTNYDKHLEKRRQLLKEFSKSYFAEVKEFGENLGKEWTAPKSYFKADKALYMPNFFGTTVASSSSIGTTSVLKGKISIVRLYSALSGEKQVNTYFASNAEAYGDVPVEKGYQIVDISVPESFVKSYISKFFEYRTKAKIGKTRQNTFFYGTKLPGDLNLSIGFVNKFAGYVYLVDKDCKIRWAASGPASDEEKESLQRSLAGLIGESASNVQK